MAVDRRHSQFDLEALSNRARSTDFYELLRRLERPGKRFGRTGGASSDPARLGQKVRMSFATSDVEGVDIPEDGSIPHVAVNAIGLFGPEGPMPLHVTKWMMDRASNRWFANDDANVSADTAFLDFANVLQHRMIGFYWRSWADMRPEVQQVQGNGGSLGAMVRALAGIGLDQEASSNELDNSAKLRHATSLFQRVESPRRLVEYLSTETRQKVELVEFVGVWNKIPSNLQTRLGRTSLSLGNDAVIGSRFYDRSNRVEVRLGPMSYSDYRSFISDELKRDRVRNALRFVSGGALKFDVRIILAANDVPEPRLRAVRLGQSVWIGDAQEIDRGDYIMRDFGSSAWDVAA